MRQVVFICHANPEDNEFTLWLASRLKLLGYDVWCDLKELLGGEKHWEVIYKVLKNDSCKFLFVVSKSICIEPGKLKDGISKEFSLAESVSKTQEDFIIPLKIDKDSSYDSFIGQNRFTHISFVESWAEGFQQLISKLNKDNVPTQKLDKDIEKSWYFEPFIKKFELIKKQEAYFTNWWPIGDLPEYFEIYKYQNEQQARDIDSLNHLSTVVRHGDSVGMLGYGETKLTYNTFSDTSHVRPIENFSLRTIDVIEGEYKSNSYPSSSDAEYLLKRLLKRSFHLTMREKGLRWHFMSSKQPCYYYPLSSKQRINFIVNGKNKKKSLIGEFRGAYWHFGVSCSVILTPSPCFVLKSHILFSDDGEEIWNDKEKLHRARRQKGRRFFNEEWRDFLLAFIMSLRDDSGEIRFVVDPGLKILMSDKPAEVLSNMGYVDPADEKRQGILDSDEEELIDESTKEEDNESK